MSLRTSSKHLLNIFRDGDSTTFPGHIAILQLQTKEQYRKASVSKEAKRTNLSDLLFTFCSNTSFVTRCTTYNITLCLAMFQAQNVLIIRQMMESTQPL